MYPLTAPYTTTTTAPLAGGTGAAGGIVHPLSGLVHPPVPPHGSGALLHYAFPSQQDTLAYVDALKHSDLSQWRSLEEVAARAGGGSCQGAVTTSVLTALYLLGLFNLCTASPTSCCVPPAGPASTRRRRHVDSPLPPLLQRLQQNLSSLSLEQFQGLPHVNTPDGGVVPVHVSVVEQVRKLWDSNPRLLSNVRCRSATESVRSSFISLSGVASGIILAYSVAQLNQCYPDHSTLPPPLQSSRGLTQPLVSSRGVTQAIESSRGLTQPSATTLPSPMPNIWFFPVPRRSTVSSRHVDNGYPVPSALPFIPVPGVDDPPDGCPRNEVMLDDGRCAPLLSALQCPYHHWVLLNSRTGRGECVPRLCGDGRIYVTLDQLCHDVHEPGLCPETQRLYVDAFGGAVCDCPDGLYQGPGGQCHVLYEPAYCAHGTVMQFHLPSKTLMCGKDPCGHVNANLWPEDLPFAPREDGFCYQFNEQGPCEGGERFGFSTETLRAQCVSLLEAGLVRPKRSYMYHHMSFPSDTPDQPTPHYQVSYVILNGTTWGLEVKGVGSRDRRDIHGETETNRFPFIDTRNIPAKLEILLTRIYAPDPKDPGTGESNYHYADVECSGAGVDYDQCIYLADESYINDDNEIYRNPNEDYLLQLYDTNKMINITTEPNNTSLNEINIKPAERYTSLNISTNLSKKQLVQKLMRQSTNKYTEENVTTSTTHRPSSIFETNSLQDIFKVLLTPRLRIIDTLTQPQIRTQRRKSQFGRFTTRLFDVQPENFTINPTTKRITTNRMDFLTFVTDGEVLKVNQDKLLGNSKINKTTLGTEPTTITSDVYSSEIIKVDQNQRTTVNRPPPTTTSTISAPITASQMNLYKTIEQLPNIEPVLVVPSATLGTSIRNRNRSTNTTSTTRGTTNIRNRSSTRRLRHGRKRIKSRINLISNIRRQPVVRGRRNKDPLRKRQRGRRRRRKLYGGKRRRRRRRRRNRRPKLNDNKNPELPFRVPISVELTEIKQSNIKHNSNRTIIEFSIPAGTTITEATTSTETSLKTKSIPVTASTSTSKNEVTEHRGADLFDDSNITSSDISKRFHTELEITSISPSFHHTFLPMKTTAILKPDISISNGDSSNIYVNAPSNLNLVDDITYTTNSATPDNDIKTTRRTRPITWNRRVYPKRERTRNVFVSSRQPNSVGGGGDGGGGGSLGSLPDYLRHRDRRQLTGGGGIIQAPLLSACKPGAKRDYNYKCRPKFIPQERRRRASDSDEDSVAAPVPPRIKCPQGTQLDPRGKCQAASSMLG